MPLFYFVFSFLTNEVSYPKKYKNFLEKNTEFIFAIGFQTAFCGTFYVIDSSKLYFADQIFAI